MRFKADTVVDVNAGSKTNEIVNKFKGITINNGIGAVVTFSSNDQKKSDVK